MTERLEPLELLKQLSEAGNCRASIRELIQCVMLAFGGPPGLARELKLDFEACEKGSANRIKIETTIIGLLQAFVSEEADEFEDEETLTALAKQLRDGNGDQPE